MKFVALIKTSILLLAAATLTACGGGGGGSDNAFTPNAPVQISAVGSPTSLGINSSIDISVRVVQPNGAPVADGSSVNGSVSPAGLGNLSSLTGTSTAATAGGNAAFRFQSGGQTGTVSLTFSVADPNQAGRTVSTTMQVGISGTSTGDSRLVLTPVRTTLPVNAFNIGPFLGSPYLTEVTITARTASGQPINLQDGVQVSVNPVGSSGGFTTLDDGETDDVNEFLVRLGQGPVDVVGGRATIFVHSLNFSGTTTLTATMQDPQTLQTVIATQVFNISTVTPPLPTAVTISQASAPTYVQGSGGNTSAQFEIAVQDGIGQPVPDPVAGNNAFNNVRVELVGTNSGERISGINAQGQSVSGSVGNPISVRTTNGVAGVIFTSGTNTGTIQLRATADRADNNVDNGISDAVVGDRGVAISDGRLFNVQITQPFANALFINPVDPNAEPPADGEFNIPPAPDGSYSLTVAAIGTDRLGNPVIPGTAIKFGLIDEPQSTGNAVFSISGFDGNPQESGTLFTAQGGAFTTAGGGAGPGDALVIFGKDVVGNRDHESARVVSNINSATSLTVQRRFNRNDDTGISVDSGGVLPYIIGRAQDGNITADGFTNEFGVARTTMNYPVSRLGKRVVVWAQGEGDLQGGTPETVTDAAILAFAGVAPLTITASPNSIPANVSTSILVCVQDALRAPLQGVSIGFTFGALDGNGSVDGQSNAGVLGSLTGADGCSVAQVTTSGVSEDGGTLVFFVGSATAEVEIVRGSLVLQARPSVVANSSTLVTLTLVNGSGTPQPGFAISGECTGENGTVVGLQNGPGTTNANGQTTVVITATNLDQIGMAGGGECIFSTADGSATTTVQIVGQDICTLGFSPQPPGCPNSTTPQSTLTVNLAGTEGGSVTSTPAGMACSKIAGGPSQTCTAMYNTGTSVTLVAVPTAGNADAVFTGECVPGAANRATAVMSANRTCTVTFNP